MTNVTYTALFTQLPQIAGQPASLVVNPGSPATFSLSATGPGPLYYFWQQNGAALLNATNTSYTLGSAQLADSGSLFSCIVSNAGGPVSSQSAKLTVRPAFGLVSVVSNAFSVVLDGAPGSNYAVQVSTDLITWTTLATVPSVGAKVSFIDTNIAAPHRFYRISGAQ